MPKTYASMVDRILANSVESTESFYNGTACWVWIGAVRVNKGGRKYGKINVRVKRGPNKGKVRSLAVHRLVLMVFKGRRMSPRTVGRHLCNNTLCCNPEHLVGGSQKANIRQCVREGRHRSPFNAVNCTDMLERSSPETESA